MQNRAQLVQFGLATAVGLAGIFVNPGNWSSPQNTSLTTQAQAEIGRPLTPGSIAGVNRRVHRRAARRGYYGYGAAGALGVAGAYLGSQYYNSYYDQNDGSYPGLYYGSYAYSPSQYYGNYGSYAAAYPGSYYGSYAAAYPASSYGVYANRSYVAGRPTLLPRYYNAGWGWGWGW